MKRLLIVAIGLLVSSVMFLRCSPSSSSGGGTASVMAYAVDSANNLLYFSITSPATITTTTAITGTFGSEQIVAMDFRTVDGGLYGLGASGRMYSINLSTAVATVIGSPNAYSGASSWGWDYNPALTVDRIRVVTDNQLNYRLNPTTGALVTADTPLTYAGGDPNVAATPDVVGAAYSNNTLNGASATLYVIDKSLDILAIQTPPNNGTLNTVGALGINTDADTSFDIRTSGSTNTAYAVLTAPASAASSLYSVDLTTGSAFLLGNFGGGLAIRAFAVAP